MQHTFTLKWSPDDQSQAILLTYQSRWEPRLRAGDVSVEFRLSGPRNLVPHIVYAYLTTPVRAIIARIDVTDSGWIAVDEAVALSSGALLSPSELRSYAAGRQELYFYRYGAIQIARKPITYATLSTNYDYWPSSNFFPLSRIGQETLDRLGDFQRAGT